MFLQCSQMSFTNCNYLCRLVNYIFNSVTRLHILVKRFCNAPDSRNVLGSAAAAATQCVHEMLLAKRPDLLRHFRPLLVVSAHRIWQARVGVAEDEAVSAAAQVCDVR